MIQTIIYDEDGEVNGNFEKGMEWAIEAVGEMLGVSANDYSWDAATEEWEGDVRAVMGNMLTAALGEERVIAGKTLEEWKEFARRDDCLDEMVPSDLRQLLGATPEF